MHGDSVLQDDDAKPPIVGFFHPNPAPQPAVRLQLLVLGVTYRQLNPYLLDLGAIRTLADCVEILGRLHTPLNARGA